MLGISSGCSSHLKSGCSRATGKSVSMRVAFWWGPSRPPLSSSLASSARRASSSSFSPSLLWQLPIATTYTNACFFSAENMSAKHQESMQACKWMVI